MLDSKTQMGVAVPEVQARTWELWVAQSGLLLPVALGTVSVPLSTGCVAPTP